jgi:hypothetical protein
MEILMDEGDFGDDNKKKQQRRLSGENKCHSGGLTTILWIKRFFGVCGELW